MWGEEVMLGLKYGGLVPGGREDAYKVVTTTAITLSLVSLLTICTVLPVMYSYVQQMTNFVESELDFCEVSEKNLSILLMQLREGQPLRQPHKISMTKSKLPGWQWRTGTGQEGPNLDTLSHNSPDRFSRESQESQSNRNALVSRSTRNRHSYLESIAVGKKSRWPGWVLPIGHISFLPSLLLTWCRWSARWRRCAGASGYSWSGRRPGPSRHHS